MLYKLLQCTPICVYVFCRATTGRRSIAYTAADDGQTFPSSICNDFSHRQNVNVRNCRRNWLSLIRYTQKYSIFGDFAPKLPPGGLLEFIITFFWMIWRRLVSSRVGSRALSVAGPQAWNQLPASLRHTNCVATFKRHLKTILFTVAYGATDN